MKHLPPPLLPIEKGINYFRNRLLITSILIILFFGLISVLTPGCHPPGGGGNSDPCLPANMQFGTVKLTLNKLFKSAPNRDPSYSPSQYPDMWSSVPSISVYPEKGLHGAYYCEVRVTSPDCKYFHEEYLWDTKENFKFISVPANFTFQVKVAYFEVCGDFYENSIAYSETEWSWVSSYYLKLPSEIKTTKFSYVGIKTCS